MGWSHGIRWTDEKIEDCLSEVAQELGRMPTHAELVERGMGALSVAIGVRGGVREWASRLGVKAVGKGGNNKRLWTDEKIESELLVVTEELGRMPTVTELKAMKRNDLSCAISKGHGFHEWAKRLGVGRKGHHTHKGQKWERHETEFFRSLGLTVEEQTTGAPFDLLVNGHRVDVKAGSFSSPGWYKFGAIKRGVDCDFFDVLCIGDDDDVTARFVIPASAARVKSLTLIPSVLAKGAGKYGKYRDAIDPLRR